MVHQRHISIISITNEIIEDDDNGLIFKNKGFASVFICFGMPFHTMGTLMAFLMPLTLIKLSFSFELVTND